MELNNGQIQCVDALIDWWNHHKKTKQVFEISGPAGSGKTTIINTMIDKIPDITLKNVIFVAFVGKAAMQMQQHGLNAATIHSTIYTPMTVPKRDENGKIITVEGRPVMRIKFVKVLALPKDIKLIVVDEAPMVPDKLARELLSFKIPIIALGDKNQLKPVGGKPYFLNYPDFILTEVMRQAKDSPILSLSQQIIQSDRVIFPPLGSQKNGQLVVMRRDDFMINHFEETLKADIVICWKNESKEHLNKLIRKKHLKARGLDPNTELPLRVDDKIICRKNNWNICTEHLNLINGLVGTVTHIDMESKSGDVINIDFAPECAPDEIFHNIPLNIKYFTGTKAEKDRFKIGYEYDGELFDYGYAITCHLSQGSQYDYVIVFVEDGIKYRKEFKNWLYTAVTRAKTKLLLVI